MKPLSHAMSVLGVTGKTAYFGMLEIGRPKPGETLDVDFNPFWRDDITVKTCYGAAPRDNQEALELISHGTIAVTDMVTHRFGIDDIGEAFLTGAKPDGCLKVIIEPNR